MQQKHNITKPKVYASLAQKNDQSRRRGVFKQCTLCGEEWSTKDEFLSDEDIYLNGYQWNKKKLRAGEDIAGLLIFTHRKAECGTTLGIAARKFKVAATLENSEESMFSKATDCCQ